MEQDEADSTLKATDIKEKEGNTKSDAEKEDCPDSKSKDIEVIVSWPTISQRQNHRSALSLTLMKERKSKVLA